MYKLEREYSLVLTTNMLPVINNILQNFMSSVLSHLQLQVARQDSRHRDPKESRDAKHVYSL